MISISAALLLGAITSDAPRVGFWQNGLLGTPATSSSSGHAVGNYFETLSRYLALEGISVQSIFEASDFDESRFDIILMVNPIGIPSDEDVDRLMKFVERGGSLFLFSDHTDLEGTQTATNKWIQSSGIRLRFDSGLSGGERPKEIWVNRRFQYLQKIYDNSDLRISVGATLDIRGSAEPLVIALNGHSDLGNRANPERAFLGDYTVQPGERVGPVILAGFEKIGRGRLICFGDTSPIQNLAIPYNWNTFFRAFWHSASTANPADFSPVIAIIVGFFSVLGSALLRSQSRNKLSWKWVVIIIGPVTAGWILLRSYDHEWPVHAERLGGRVVSVSSVFMEEIESAEDPNGGVNGMLWFFQREGFRPIVSQSLDDLRYSEVLVIVDPRRRMKEAEVETVYEWLLSGGTAVVAASRRNQQFLGPLFDRFNVEITDVPLGHGIFRDGDSLAMTDAYAIGQKFKEVNNSIPPTVLIGEGQFVAAIEIKRGDGRFILLADRKFFDDKFFVMPTSVLRPKIEFLKSLEL